MSSGRAAARSTSERARAAPAALVRVAELQRETSPTGFAMFCDLFAPELQRNPNAYQGRAYLALEGGGWTRAPRTANVPDLLAVHIAAGATGEAVDVGRRSVRALSLAPAYGERARVLNLDVDVDAARVVPALLDVFEGRALVVPGSGRPGRCRVLVPLAERLPARVVHRLGLALVERIGAPLVEVFPHPGVHTRLPGGATLLGGHVLLDSNLQPIRRVHPLTFAVELRDLERSHGARLAEVVERIGARVVVELQATKPLHTKSLHTSPRRTCDTTTRAQVADWWRNGVSGHGERDRARYALVRDCLAQGWSLSQARGALAAWVEDGGLRRASPKHSRHPRSEVRDALRVVERVYKTHPHPGRPKPEHLTVAEVAEVERIAEQAAKRTGLPAARFGSFLYDILPRFKAAAPAEVRVHCDEWQKAGGPRYTRLRDACGLFERRSGYLPAFVHPELAHACAWSCTFQFEPNAAPPRRPLGATYQAARLAVATKLRRGTFRPARATPNPPQAQGKLAK